MRTWVVTSAVAFLGLSLADAREARAADGAGQSVFLGFLYIGLPAIDGSIFIGGLTTAIGGTVAVGDDRPSGTWSTMNYVFGGLNSASTVAYAITAGLFGGSDKSSTSGIGGMFVWPSLAHAGVAIADFIIGWQNAQAPATAPGPRFVVTPMVSPGPDRVVGLEVAGTAF